MLDWLSIIAIIAGTSITTSLLTLYVFSKAMETMTVSMMDHFVKRTSGTVIGSLFNPTQIIDDYERDTESYSSDDDDDVLHLLARGAGRSQIEDNSSKTL